MMFNLDFEELDKEHRSNRSGTREGPCRLRVWRPERREAIWLAEESTPQAEEGQSLLGATFGGSLPLCIGGVVYINCQGG